jgi:hypothetical protein
MKSNPRVLILTLPVMCLVTAVLLLLALPVSVAVVIWVMFDPTILDKSRVRVQRRVMKRMIGGMMGTRSYV